jgi:hypothetical protein
MSDSPPNDSPLSITASVTGIFTFVVAISAAIWLRVSALRSADTEYFRVKTALNWYKTESEWIHDLVATQREVGGPGRSSFDSYFLDRDVAWREKQGGRQRETEMYVFVLDQLGTLEERLLEMVTAVDVKAEGSWQEWQGEGGSGGWSWGMGRWWKRTRIGMHWLPVRTKALELVRQRDALGNRVLFAQLAMLSS